MNLETMTTVSLESFRERVRGKKVILLYPWTTYRMLFLTHFLSHNESGLLYYRIAEGQTSLKTWMAGLVDEFDRVLDGFGGQLKQALEKSNPTALGEALAADLGHYRKKREQLVLFTDELDRIPFDASFEQFIIVLVASLPKNIQVAFNARSLTHQPWYDLVGHGEAVVMGREQRQDEGLFTLPTTRKPQLEVYALGRGYVLVNGQLITNWDGALPRNLFYFFIDRTLVTRAEIFQIFWPQLPVKEATNVFHVTKRKISERISVRVNPQESFELTRYDSGFYKPSDKLIRHYDVASFQTTMEQAMMTGDEHKEEILLKQAVEAYKAPFLQDDQMAWMVERREQLRQLNAQALISLGQLNQRRGDLEVALGYFIRSLKEIAQREDIHREVMKIYLKLGRRNDALTQYQTFVEILRRDLNIKPSRESQDLYQLIEQS
jgi:DNA-binding SARP family transcriptional activator